MVKTYRTIHQWNHWLTSFLGKSLLTAELNALSLLTLGHYGNNALLLGATNQHTLLQSSAVAHQFLLGPLFNREKNMNYIEGEFYELPIQSGSIDQVFVPHMLELTDNPHQLLSEACRIVKPEGYIFIIGFNPYSLWGLKKLQMKNKNVPWSGNFIHPSTIKKWLALVDFELETQQTLYFRPPTQHRNVFNNLKFLEWIGNKCYKPFGGIYIIKAKAKVIPLTPIRMQWTQELSGAGAIDYTISGSSIRKQL